MKIQPNFAAGKRVLIAEDNDGVAKTLVEAFRAEGFRTQRVRDGIAAINCILGDRPDVVLLDRHLPRLSGDDVCQMVRKTESVRHIPIVFLSGLIAVEDRVAAFELGADDYVTKPFAMDEVLARVEAVLMRGQRRQNLVAPFHAE